MITELVIELKLEKNISIKTRKLGQASENVRALTKHPVLADED